MLVTQSCPTLCYPLGPPGSSVHGSLQARILEWVAILFSKGSSRARDGTRVSCTTGGFFTESPGRYLEAPSADRGEGGGDKSETGLAKGRGPDMAGLTLVGSGGEGWVGGRGPRDSLSCILFLKPRWLMPKAPSSFPAGHFQPSQSPSFCDDRHQPSPQTGGLPCPPSAASACPRADRCPAELAVRSGTSD